MSRLVESPVPPKILPSALNKEGDDEEEKKKMMMIEDMSHFCVIDQQPQKDKGGRTCSRWKQLILETSNLSVAAEKSREKQGQGVEIVGISIICPDRPEIFLSEPFVSSPKACLFTLKEGTRYRLKFAFFVSNKLVSGLKYVNTLWRAGIRVDRTTVELGSYSPEEKAHEFEVGEETLPCGVLVRGLYSARTKVTDSEGRCYMDTNYYFNIQKNWPSIS